MLEPGEILQSRYAIETLIGEGGMGRVYLSRQTMLRGLRVAVKEIAFDTVHEDERAAAVEAFRREAETLASLSHPNLVGVKDCFEEKGKVYLVMEYVDGRTLEATVAAEGALPIRSVIEYAQQLCTVLTYLHTVVPPVIFRDLKPSNIMLDGAGTVRLVDFGLAQTEGDSDGGKYLGGTPGYAPIEQLMDIDLPCDPRSDIYGLGATLYHLLGGEPPLDACSRLADDELVPLAQVRPEVPVWLSDGITKMLALRPEDRFDNAMQVRDLLDSNEPAKMLHMAPVLPMFDRLPGGNAAPRIDAFLRDALGRRLPIEIFDFDNRQVRFSSELRRWGRQPRELYFNLRGQQEPVRVAILSMEVTVEQGRSVYDVHMADPPLPVLRVLRDGLRPHARVGAQHERTAVRRDVSLPVVMDEIGVVGRAIDMSEGGCRLVTTDPLPLGRQLTLAVLLEDVVLPDVDVVGEVRWCRARWGGGYESGLGFVDVDDRTVDVLHLYFDQWQQALLSA